MEQLKNSFVWLRNYMKECNRVLKITKKPTNEEFKTIAKASALGILLVGFIGFLVQFIKSIIMGVGV